MRQIIDFNHISKSIPEDEREQLISYFKTYHKKWYCAKKANRYYGRLIKLIFYTPLLLTTSGIVTAGSLFNPFLLILSGAGIFISTGFKRLEPKLEQKKIIV